MDDKLILQRGGGMGEGSYDLPSAPPNPWTNHAVWFDRDGVDQWQAQMWGAIDGVTYNTAGIYEVVLSLHSTDADSGTAYMTVNGEGQGFYVPNWHSGPLVPGTDVYPAGMIFTGDMTAMQVFYGLYGYEATHSVAFEDIVIDGCLRYDFDGFYQPIDMEAVNLAKAGQAIPVKWRLANGNGVPISDPASFVRLRSMEVACESGESLPQDVEEYAPGSSGLQYLGDGYWQFNWKTQKRYAGTCRDMWVVFNNQTTSPTVTFMFKG
jgi:hypothetical protein